MKAPTAQSAASAKSTSQIAKNISIRTSTAIPRIPPRITPPPLLKSGSKPTAPSPISSRAWHYGHIRRHRAPPEGIQSRDPLHQFSARLRLSRPGRIEAPGHRDRPAQVRRGRARRNRHRLPRFRRKISNGTILERSMSAPLLKIREELAAQIRAHGVETYPYECCGAILGRDGDGSREVIALLALANRRDDSPRNRFEVTPGDVQLAEKTAREKNIELIGWYHSHPDAPARPSEFDREHAWPWYSYIIVSVQSGQPRDMNSWRLRDDRSAYDSEAIESSAHSASI